MASYYIDIIDTASELDQLVLKSASASGITLQWNGGDKKDELIIVSSQLDFDMISEDAADASFIDLFTGDEHRFQVFVKNTVDDSILWQGFILPDLYSEPYKNGVFFVQFTAVDCLGRLKGKYLPDDYYSREKSVIDILCQCLQLTGLELDMYFNPAIENYVQKDWDLIYIDTENYLDKGKKQDAYTILETLLGDMLCVVYQCDNRWYIEGINTRHQRSVTYKIYDIDGALTGTLDYTRLLKSIKPLLTPTITSIPPYNEISITETKTAIELVPAVVKEKNDGWALVTGVKGELYSSEWVNHGTLPRCVAPDYNVRINHPGNVTGDYFTNYPATSDYASLRKKLYFAKGEKVKFSFEFKIVRYGDTNPDLALWKNPFKYEIMFNGVVLFSNFATLPAIVEDREQLIFDDSGTAKIDIEGIMSFEGLLDVRIYKPFGKIFDNKIKAIEITSAEIGVIDFSETVTETNLINGEFTIDKEFELTCSDGKTGFGNTFRLAKLKEQTTSFEHVNIPVKNPFVFDGKNYAVVDLDGANLIKQNMFEVYYAEFIPFPHGYVYHPIEVTSVVFNWNGFGEMVVETPEPYAHASFTVKKFAVADIVDSRVAWTQWTDSVYKIENSSYTKTIANIYRRMFDNVHEKIDLTALNAIKFNDIILFKYVYEKEFHVLNCAWNLDENKTTLVLGRSHYISDGSENMPPLVVACDDIYINEFTDETNLSATANDPDGYIVSQHWEKITGGFGDIIDTPDNLFTNIYELTDDYYTYKITVTDNDGATASDTVNVIRIKNYDVDLDLISTEEIIGDSVVDGELHTMTRIKKFKLDIDPDLLPGIALKFKGVVKMTISSTSVDVKSGYKIEKNGSVIEDVSKSGSGVYTDPLTLGFISGDEIFIYLSITSDVYGNEEDDTVTIYNVGAEIKINTVEVVSGVANVTGLPIEFIMPNNE